MEAMQVAQYQSNTLDEESVEEHDGVYENGDNYMIIWKQKCNVCEKGQNR